MRELLNGAPHLAATPQRLPPDESTIQGQRRLYYIRPFMPARAMLSLRSHGYWLILS